MKPKIGTILTCIGEQTKKYTLNRLYVHAIAAHGGLPVGLPHGTPEDARAYVSGLDGLLLPGGIDVNPLVYGEETTKAVTLMSQQLDYFETALIKETIAQGKPVLGICRGMQILNVALGGTLIQDLNSQHPSQLCHNQDSSIGSELVHSVGIEPNSHLHQIFGADRINVNSYHHQAVKEVAPGLRVAATAPDGIIEAIESADGLVCAVQWHPELLFVAHPLFSNLFTCFIEKAKGAMGL